MKSRFFTKRTLVFAAFAVLAVLGGGSFEVSAQGKGASDKLIDTLATAVMQSLPSVVKDAKGEEVPIDKDKAAVPKEQMQETILVATQVSNAAQCGMEELANAYWITYRRSLKTSGKWTPSQRVFMAQLFNLAVRFSSANEAKAVSGDEETVLKNFKKIECADKKRDALKAQILANIKALQKS